MRQNNNLQKNLSPIALFVYNRPEHTRKTVEALRKNTLAKESELFIFSDGPKDKEDENKIMGVRKFIKNITGFKNVTIIEREANLGLAKSIIGGVSEIVDKFGKIIVLEDDLVTSLYFLEYMNNGLDLYEKNDQVISIHGYIYPVKKSLPETFFLRGADCWSWATWKRGWDLFEPDGQKLLDELEKRKLLKIFDPKGIFRYTAMLKRQIAGLNNSWAIRWHASAFLANKLTLYPGKSLVNNIGQDGSGTHKGNSNIYTTKIIEKKIKIYRIQVKENLEARKNIINFFKSLKPRIITRVLRKMINLIYKI